MVKRRQERLISVPQWLSVHCSGRAKLFPREKVPEGKSAMASTWNQEGVKGIGWYIVCPIFVSRHRGRATGLASKHGAGYPECRHACPTPLLESTVTL